jgi:hypothetical protein
VPAPDKSLVVTFKVSDLCRDDAVMHRSDTYPKKGPETIVLETVVCALSLYEHRVKCNSMYSIRVRTLYRTRNEIPKGFFLGGKTCCAFGCTPNVDTSIEDK